MSIADFINKSNFYEWKFNIDKIIFNKIGKHIDDLSDNNYWEWYINSYTHDFVATVIYNQNYAKWFDDFQYYLNNNKINSNNLFLYKLFESGFEAKHSFKLYKHIVDNIYNETSC